MNLFAKSALKGNFEDIKQIKDWTYQILNIDSEIPISINQLQCHEPCCPPVETVIAIMTSPPQQYKIHKPISEITEIDINQLTTNN
ncbi:MAG: hypothetical protein AAFO95_05525 [Cyanobacteria bacterium J06600_6]